MFTSPEQTARDFRQICELEANLLRVYHVPPSWFLDLAAEHGLKLLVDIPWEKNLCFLESAQSQADARDTVRRAVAACQKHPAVFAYSVVNEIPAEIVRWSGPRAVAEFIDTLVGDAKTIDPECLCTFTSFPPTEFLNPQNIDFVCFNVYLHQRPAFEGYLARLQTLAGGKPLVLGEFGLDSLREGEARQAETLAWQVESAFRTGLAGTVLFSYTDDWFRDGRQIEDWAFGLTTRDRRPKKSFAAVQQCYRIAPYFPLARQPKVSIVVASYNGARTLTACLDSLTRLNYPDYEVILVDDGSTDVTPETARQYPQIRCLRQAHQGLSVARNAGIAAATGEIVAFTDSDCRADEDWLYYLVGDLLRGGFTGIGGHNFLPPEDSFVAAAVLVSPGGPAHVMLTDREAEHIPGCNMAFYKWALEEAGGFDPIFTKAGDDVDICWRVQERGHKIGFSAAGFVWHYRRSTVQAYLRQQAGYGEAEALLHRKHPEYFNLWGGGIWRGRIYSPAQSSVTLSRPVIYHGVFGSGFFQKVYAPAPASALMFCTSLEYHVLLTLPLLSLSVAFPVLWPVALTSLLISLAVCGAAATQAELPKRKMRLWSRPLVALLFFLQPMARGWARYQWRLTVRSHPQTARPPSARPPAVGQSSDHAAYWSDAGLNRYTLLKHILAALERQAWQCKADSGWSDHDVEIFGNGWSRLRLATVSEERAPGRTLFRCRLRAAWSLRARMLFWSQCGLVMVVIGALAPMQPWLWLLLLLLPVTNLFLDHEQRVQQQQIFNLLDEVAREHQLVKLETAQSSPLRS